MQFLFVFFREIDDKKHVGFYFRMLSVVYFCTIVVLLSECIFVSECLYLFQFTMEDVLLGIG